MAKDIMEKVDIIQKINTIIKRDITIILNTNQLQLKSRTLQCLLRMIAAEKAKYWSKWKNYLDKIKPYNTLNLLRGTMNLGKLGLSKNGLINQLSDFYKTIYLSTLYLLIDISNLYIINSNLLLLISHKYPIQRFE